MMLKPLKFRSNKNKILFCSDFHCNHTPSWSPAPFESRGFSSITEHDDWIRAAWEKHVDEDTVIFCLGDCVFNDPKGEWMEDFCSWKGKTYLVNGNHLSGTKQIYRKALGLDIQDALTQETYPVSYENITFVGDSLHSWIDGQSVFMTHYAQYIWPELGNEGIQVCGHSHSTCPALNVGNDSHGKILDIGVDNAIEYNSTPFFTWEQVRFIIGEKKKKVVDHHDGSVAGQ